MSNYSVIYDSLIKLGLKPQQAHKVSKELVEKAKNRPVLSDEELKREIERLSNAISDLSPHENKQAINYFHGILQGVLATGVFELLVLLKSWLSSVFMSAPSPEIQELLRLKTILRFHVEQQFSSEVVDIVFANAIKLDASKAKLVEAALCEVGNSNSEFAGIITESLENLAQVVEHKHAVELGIINKT